ncbi:MAG: CotH kinase family protein [Deltaproteobacteria bacterium]|nr:CotH kinase family protein [Deltaproteobacteria bacterium]
MRLNVCLFLFLSTVLCGCLPNEKSPVLLSIDRSDTATGVDTDRGDSNESGTEPTESNETEDLGGDTEPPPFWIPKGPKQLTLGQVEISCDPSVLITEDGEWWLCDPAPVPCVPDDPKVNCHIAVRGEAGVTIYDGPVGIERRGRSSMYYDKPNYAIEFRDENGEDNPAPCMGMGKESDWVLDGSWMDRSFIRNDFVLDIFSELGVKTHYGPDSRFVTLTFNGAPRGIYRLVEKIKRDDDRVDIPKDDGTGKNFIIKHDIDGDLSMSLGLESDSWSTVYPNPDKVTDTQRSAISDWMQALADALNSGDAFTMLNMDNLVDYVLLQELSKNIDGFQYSLYIFKQDGALANMVPWDFDLSFGQPDVAYAGDVPNESPEGWILHHTNFIARLLDDDVFVQRLQERWVQLRTLPLSDDAVDTRIDEYLMVLKGAPIDDNFDIWPIGDVRFDHIYSVYHVYSIESYDAEIAKLRQWIHDRLDWMDEHLLEYQAFSDKQ